MIKNLARITMGLLSLCLFLLSIGLIAKVLWLSLCFGWELL
jgi:hypothetical protein